MAHPLDKDVIDTLASELFNRDHPDRAWDATAGHTHRLGVASALEKAVYRGFATAKTLTRQRDMPAPEIAAAALVDGGRGFKRSYEPG